LQSGFDSFIPHCATQPFQDKLRVIDNKRQDGKFVEKDGSIPAGQACVQFPRQWRRAFEQKKQSELTND